MRKKILSQSDLARAIYVLQSEHCKASLPQLKADHKEAINNAVPSVVEAIKEFLRKPDCKEIIADQLNTDTGMYMWLLDTIKDARLTRDLDAVRDAEQRVVEASRFGDFCFESYRLMMIKSRLDPMAKYPVIEDATLLERDDLEAERKRIFGDHYSL